MSINHVTISGNLTRDAELRTTPGGSYVLAFGVAVNERRKNQQTQQWEDVPNFVDCNMFGTRAEKLAQYLTKGAKVALSGRLHYSSWEKDGQRRSRLDVYVDELEFMSSRGIQKHAQGDGQPLTTQSVMAAATPVASDHYADEDIPF